MSEARTTRSTCPYCGTGCGVLIESVNDQIVNVKGDPDHPANFGRLCTKGSTLHLTASQPVTVQTRLLRPQIRSQRDSKPEAATWDQALEKAADKLAQIIRDHGPEAVGFYGSGQLLTEDYYVLNKLVKGLIGTNNLDTNSRLCMSSAVAGYKATLGADAPPACYDDFKHANTLFIVGANTAYAHPILFRRIEDAKQANPDLKLIVADPRRTETAEMADLFLPIQPGTDVALFHGLLHVMLAEQTVDHDFIAAHTEGFDALQALVAEFTPEHVARICGVPAQDVVQAARWMGAHTPTLSLYCQGLNQSTAGTAKNAALINLHLATGQIGKPGSGPFSLTGQPNAMGGREVGGMANLLSAHRDLSNAHDRAEVAALWGVPDVPATPGKTAVEMFEAAARGEIKALWIACTNPAQSLPDQATVREALRRAELVVVQEAFATTATCDYADILLPATTWGEKEGTVTNSERRISRVRPAIPPAGQAQHDWQIFTAVGRMLEARMPERVARYRPDTTTLFPYDSAESVWNEHRESTRGRDLDITGLSYALLETLGPQQWPMPEGSEQGQVRLYTDGRFATSNGKAKFAALPYVPVAEAVDEAYPYSLNTGRLRDQWHGMSRTGTLGRLFGHVAEPTLDMHALDIVALGLKDGDLVRVASRRGAVVAPVRASESVQRQQAFMAMHWGPEYLGGSDASGQAMQGVNALTQPRFCPSSKQPELKHAAVSIERIDLPWRLTAVAWMPEDAALAAREQLKPMMTEFGFASCVPFGREPDEQHRVGVLFRAASQQPIGEAQREAIARALGLLPDTAMQYHDDQQHQHRLIQLAQRGDNWHLTGALLCGETVSEAWLKPLLQEDLPVNVYGQALLAPVAEPPVKVASQGRQVCTCFNVTEPAIIDVVQACGGTADARLHHLQAALKCGTNCGSCIPELRKIIKITPVVEAVS